MLVPSLAPMLLMGRDFDAWEERGRLLVQMPDEVLSVAGDRKQVEINAEEDDQHQP